MTDQKKELTFVSVDVDYTVPGGKSFCKEMQKLNVVRVTGKIDLSHAKPKVPSDVNGALGWHFISVMGETREYKRCGHTVFARAVNAVGGKKNVQCLPEVKETIEAFLASTTFDERLRATAKDLETYLK